MDTYQVKLTFTEPVLGTVPKSKEVYRKWVQEEARKRGVADEDLEQELETIEEFEEKGWTGFHMDGETPLIYDYAIKGFFKSACYFMRQVKGSKCAKLQAYKKKINGMLMVYPRRIPLHLNGNGMDILERPLRADTAQGPRVALVRSDTCPPDTVMDFTIKILGTITENQIREWLDYGQFMGLGQWRSGGYGRFTYEMEKQ